MFYIRKNWFEKLHEKIETFEVRKDSIFKKKNFLKKE